MRVTLVRHGEVEEACIGCYNGHNDIGLSKRGMQQAEQLAYRFAGKQFDAVYCSDLRRARETLAPFVLPVAPCFTEGLREKSWGCHEGMRFEEICAREAVQYETFEQWVGLLDGEPIDDYLARIKRFFFEELAAQPHEEVLLMTHAGVLHALYALTQNVELETAFQCYFPYGAHITYDLRNNRFGEVVCPD